MESELRVGPIFAADGNKVIARAGRGGEAIVADELEDAALRGELFYGSVAVGGVDHAASFTTTAPWALYNPDGSDVDLVLLGIAMGYVSGTLGAGFLGIGKYIESATNAAPTGTTCVARGSTRLGLTTTMRGVPLETVTLTAGATLIAPVMDIAPKLATTAVDTAPKIVVLPFRIVIPPRAAAVAAGVAGAAGTTPRVTITGFWKEVKRLA